jgi:hypothetical protein
MILRLYEEKRRKVTGFQNILFLNFAPVFQIPGVFGAELGARLRSNP